MRKAICVSATFLFLGVLITGTASVGSDATAKSVTAAKAASERTETVDLPGHVTLEMVWCPAGTFMMGSSTTEKDRFADIDVETQHQVTLSQGFWMGKYELTKRQWYAVMGTKPWGGNKNALDDLDSPAVYISWDDAQSFIIALNKYTGKTFRLPTEAEWEYACRAGTTTCFYWGDEWDYKEIDKYAWYSGNASDIDEKYAHVVGKKLPNAWGLYDMSGNVWERCQDWWSHTARDYHGSDAVTNPTGPTSGAGRVLRGGSWLGFFRFCRSAYRFNYYYPPNDFTGYDIGFRVVRTP